MGHVLDQVVLTEIEDGLPVIRVNKKAKPTIVEIRKLEIAIKNKDEKTIKELETNYIFNITENGK